MWGVHNNLWRETDGMLSTRARRNHTTPRMPQAGKLIVSLLGVLTALSMAVAGAAIWLQLQEREKRQAKERELLLTLAERDELKGQLDQLQQVKSRTDEELARVRKELAGTQDKLSGAVTAQEALSRAVEDRQKEIDRLSKDLTQNRSERETLASQLKDLTSERDEMHRQLADLEKAKGELESKVTELSQQPTVELDKVVVGSDQGGGGATATTAPVSIGAASGTNGQVVVVNREYDFIVMNLGKKQGLSIGQEFQVVRGAEVLGKVKVEKIYDELSAAAILPESRKDSIREGDTVKAL